MNKLNNELGTKYDNDKPRMDLIPSEALEEIAKVLTFGAKKYGKSNWAKGIQYSRLIAATMRHLSAYNKGIDIDEESGMSHVSHAMTNLVFLCWMIQKRKDLDDRWIFDQNNIPRSAPLTEEERDAREFPMEVNGLLNTKQLVELEDNSELDEKQREIWDL